MPLRLFLVRGPSRGSLPVVTGGDAPDKNLDTATLTNASEDADCSVAPERVVVTAAALDNVFAPGIEPAAVVVTDEASNSFLAPSLASRGKRLTSTAGARPPVRRSAALPQVKTVSMIGDKYAVVIGLAQPSSLVREWALARQ